MDRLFTHFLTLTQPFLLATLWLALVGIVGVLVGVGGVVLKRFDVARDRG